MILWIKGHLNKWGLQPPNLFRLTFVTLPSNLIWPSDNQQDLKLQHGLWQEGDWIIHPFASNCRSFSLKAEGTKMSRSGCCSAAFTKTNINYRAIVWGPPNKVHHFLRPPRWWGDWVIWTQLSLSGSLCSVSNLKGKNRAPGNNSGAFLFSE